MSVDYDVRSVNTDTPNIVRYTRPVLGSILSDRQPVRATTLAALPANTRTGNVLTADANGVLPAQDGVTLVVGNRLLIKDEATGANNGIYIVTDLGSAGTPWILTRAADLDTDAEAISCAGVLVEEGTDNVNKLFILTTTNPITLNTTALTFALYSPPQDIVTVRNAGWSGGSGEEVTIRWTSNVGEVVVRRVGGGTARAIRFGNIDDQDVLFHRNGTDYWKVASGGHYNPVTDGVVDIGSSTARVRDVHLSNSVRIGTAPAGGGFLRLSNNNGVAWRNFANTADVGGWYVDANDILSTDVSGYPTAVEVLLGANNGLFINANLIEQRNGANGQAYRVFNSWTDASNNEYGEIAMSSNTFMIRSNAAGTGTHRSVQIGPTGSANLWFQTNNTARARFNSSGHLLWNTDNSLDIGASGATRPRNVYIAGIVAVGATPAGSGQVRLTNNTGISWRNAADSANVIALAVNASDEVVLGNGNFAVSIADGATASCGFFQAAPITQPSSTGQTAGFTAGAGTSANDDSTFTGGTGATAYTTGDVVRHLKLLGLIAS